MKQDPHVVIVGAGFGGLEAAKRLSKASVQITLIDKHNYHLFQPLLYQVAIAGLVPSQIAYPVRTIFRRQANLEFRLGEVTHIDFEAQFVQLDGSVIAYDTLILAVGGRTDFFGMNSLREHSFQLKDVESAINTRNHLLKMFELASREADAQKRGELLTFTVVGGGPTGVETAGALAELINLVMVKDYPSLDLTDVHVILLEAADHLMESFPEKLRKTTYDLLRKKNVEVFLNTKVVDFNGRKITLGNGDSIDTQTMIWTAGVRAEKLTDTLAAEKGRGGRIIVQPTLQHPDHPQVYVIGDAAYLGDENGQPLPMLATVAQQQARHAANNIRWGLSNRAPEPFIYKDPGLLATIGRNAAVARLWGISFSGWPAWLIWVGLHVYRLIGFRNRLVVILNWAWDYFFYESQVRLITKE
jgi:NADH:ubiquinone reductase (H+-translocating)